MQFLSKHVRLVWAIAILLMAGGHLAHAYEDLTACDEVCSGEHTSQPEPQDCPMGGECTHPFAHGVFILPDAPDRLFVALTMTSFSDHVEGSMDGPCREIDYPPPVS
jgi:hypothetical protein